MRERNLRIVSRRCMYRRAADISASARAVTVLRTMPLHAPRVQNWIFGHRDLASRNLSGSRAVMGSLAGTKRRSGRSYRPQARDDSCDDCWKEMRREGTEDSVREYLVSARSILSIRKLSNASSWLLLADTLNPVLHRNLHLEIFEIRRFCSTRCPSRAESRRSSMINFILKKDRVFLKSVP